MTGKRLPKGRERGVHLTEDERAKVIRARDIVRTATELGRRMYAISEELGEPKRPSSERACVQLVHAVLQKDRVAPHNRDLLVLVAESISERYTDEEAPFAQAKTAQQIAGDEAHSPGADSLSELRSPSDNVLIAKLQHKIEKLEAEAKSDQVQEWRDKYEDKREENVRIEAKLRAANKRLAELEKTAGTVADDLTERQKIERDMIALLKEIVMSNNGNLEKHLLKAARLVIAQERA